jgi:hypothetical protein
LKYISFVLIVLLVTIAFSALFFAVPHLTTERHAKLEHSFVGVAFCGNTTAEAQLLIDKVKDYTNVFVVQSGPVSWNETATNEICDYAVAAGLKIIVYFGDYNPRILEANGTTWRIDWTNTAKQRWGDNFLGIYFMDEWGGLWVDTDWENLAYTTNSSSRFWADATYDSVATRFVQNMQRELNYIPVRNSFQLFVSDYALYWFDYLGGYDVVLAQVGWNHSYAQDIALTRGAANMQDKDWGVILTWKYNEPPYLDSGEAIYSQMVTAYTAGAKYIVIFNYPSLEGNAYGVMQDEHFVALEQFWKEATSGTHQYNSLKAEAVLILPSNYGWGMRRLDDRIWGFWGPDDKSPQIWFISRELIAKYGTSLDIVYDDPKFSVETKYDTIYFWNAALPIS